MAVKYRDLREFMSSLESRGELKRVTAAVDPNLEMTEICDRVLRSAGPAILFENPVGSEVPALCNLFGTADRVAYGMGEEDVSSCLLYTSPSPRDRTRSRMPSSA